MIKRLDDRITCKICNKSYESLGCHIRVHGYTANEYKDEFELPRMLPLCTPEKSEKHRQSTLGQWEKGKLSHLNIAKLGVARRGVLPVITKATLVARSERVCSEETRKNLSIQAKKRGKRNSSTKIKISKSLYKYHSKNRRVRYGDSRGFKAICHNCKNEFYRSKSKTDKKIVYCSRTCFQHVWRAKNNDRNNRILEKRLNGVVISQIAKEEDMTYQAIWKVLKKCRKNFN